MKDLLAGEKENEMLRREAAQLPSWDLTCRQVATLESLLNGAFSPLEGYMDRQAIGLVRHERRLPDGTFWPVPVDLAVPETFARRRKPGDRMVLRHPEGMALAILTVSEVWEPPFGNSPRDAQHEDIRAMLQGMQPGFIAGTLEGLELPPHHTFQHFRQTPGRVRKALEKSGRPKVIGVSNSDLLSPSDIHAIDKLARENNAAVLLLQENLSALGGDFPDWSLGEIRCVRHAMEHMQTPDAILNIVPPVAAEGFEAEMLRAIIARNFGCTHYAAAKGKAFDILSGCARQMGIEMLAIPMEAGGGELPESEIVEKVRGGEALPEGALHPEVVEELRESFPPPARQGFTVFFTGLSGSGKSTVANALVARLVEIGGRPVTLLDGDIVRKNLSSELTFSREHRDLNIQRIGFVAEQIVKNRGIAVCAPIAPYRQIRRRVRESIEWYGSFIEVYVSTPLEVCEQRDRKGLYAKARQGLIKQFTGIDDPYEAPENAELVIDTSQVSVDDAVDRVVDYLRGRGLLGQHNGAR